MASTPPAPGWRSLLTPAALPRFALVCLGTWLTAADTLVTATMMPTIAREIGGYAWFGWSVAAFVLGSIVAGATSGRLSLAIGLRSALMLGGLVYGAGCVLSALAPEIFTFLAGRTIQGIGGGWTAGLCYVAVTALFAEAQWPRVLSGLAAVWGGATLTSPLIGGLFAQGGFWRGGFWLFAAQGVAFIGFVAWLVPRRAAANDLSGGLPWRQVLALGGGIVLLSAAGVLPQGPITWALIVLAAIFIGVFLRIDGGSRSPLLPRRTTDLRSLEGAGLAMIFAFTCATVNFTVYGAAMMQALHGASPVVAGYVLVMEAAGWTIVAFLLAGKTEQAASAWIRIGAVTVTLGLAMLAWAAPFGSLAAIAVAAIVQGAGFGCMWALATSRIAAAAPPSERALASAAVPTTQLIGSAVGAAISALIANASGFDAGITRANAAVGGVWLFAAFLPLALAGVWAAWRLGATPPASSESG